MKENFEKAVEFILHWETGFGKTIYTKNINDPGGETKWGICKKYYPKLDIRNLTKEQAIQIYKSKYWDMMDCDSLPNHIDVVIFDIAVNPGISVAKKSLARLKDFAKLLVPDTKLASLFLIIEALDYYDDITNFNRFGRGWTKRKISLAKYIISDYTFLVYDD